MPVFKCNNCGAPIRAPDGATAATCEYCGSEISLPINKIASLLRRAFMLLKDGDFVKADEHFEAVLDLHPENSKAYLGKLMCSTYTKTEEELAELHIRLEDQRYFKKALEFANDTERARLLAYAKQTELNILEDEYVRAQQLLMTQSYYSAGKAFDELNNYKDSETKAREAYANYNKERRNAAFKKKIKVILVLTVICIIICGIFCGMHTMNNAPGTVNNPIVIHTADDLDNVRNNLDAYYILANDIDLNGRNWIPIGAEEYNPLLNLFGNTQADSKKYAFTGVFDGNNHVIYNLHVYSDEKYSYSGGLFNHVYHGTIKNVKLANPQIEVSGGTITGYLLNSQIINCHVSGAVLTTGIKNAGYFGGIAGVASYSEGLLGDDKPTEINSSSFNGYIGPCISGSGITDDVNKGTIIKDCTSSGSIDASRGAHGICTGVDDVNKYNDGTIINCHSSMTINLKTNNK